MLRALGIVTDNIDSGRMIGTVADRYCSRSVLQQICAAAWLAVYREARRKR